MRIRKTRKGLFGVISLSAFFMIVLVLLLDLVSASSASVAVGWTRIEDSDSWETVTDLDVGEDGKIFMVQSYDNPYDRAQRSWKMYEYLGNPNSWYWNPKMAVGNPNCYQRRIACFGRRQAVFQLWSDDSTWYWYFFREYYVPSPPYDRYESPGTDIASDLNEIAWMIDKSGKVIKYSQRDNTPWLYYSYIPNLYKYEYGISIDAVSYLQNPYKVIREIWITTNYGRIMYTKATSYTWNVFKVYYGGWYSCNYGGIKGYDIAVAPRRSHSAEVWITSTNYNHPTYGYSIYRLNRGARSWELANGLGVRITVLPDGNPVVVNREGDIWKGSI